LLLAAPFETDEPLLYLEPSPQPPRLFQPKSCHHRVPPNRFFYLQTLHIYTIISHTQHLNRIKTFFSTLEPSNAIWHLDREDARNHYASWSIANTMWSGLTAGWFALSTFVFVATTLRRFPDVAGPRYPLFSGPLSAPSLFAARQPLRIVYDLATGLKAAVIHAPTY
jgi:hypothetical protein